MPSFIECISLNFGFILIIDCNIFSMPLQRHHSITFCGITMKNYVERNISSKSQTTLKYAMKMLSGSSETIIFMFLGVATIHDDHEWNWEFISLTILFCTVFRAIGNYTQCMDESIRFYIIDFLFNCIYLSRP